MLITVEFSEQATQNYDIWFRINVYYLLSSFTFHFVTNLTKNYYKIIIRINYKILLLLYKMFNLLIINWRSNKQKNEKIKTCKIIIYLKKNNLNLFLN